MRTDPKSIVRFSTSHRPMRMITTSSCRTGASMIPSTANFTYLKVISKPSEQSSQRSCRSSKINTPYHKLTTSKATSESTALQDQTFVYFALLCCLVDSNCSSRKTNIEMPCSLWCWLSFFSSFFRCQNS